MLFGTETGSASLCHCIMTKQNAFTNSVLWNTVPSLLFLTVMAESKTLGKLDILNGHNGEHIPAPPCHL
jgi:hypothetical protein